MEVGMNLSVNVGIQNLKNMVAFTAGYWSCIQSAPRRYFTEHFYRIHLCLLH
jgi:hypothetical protein